tara:strand:+ start:248 stop:442 length:195 start_codon:yes stop_codon:yes gene_type:complete
VAQKGVPPACAHLLLEALVFLKHRVSALFLSELEGNSHRASDRSERAARAGAQILLAKFMPEFA